MDAYNFLIVIISIMTNKVSSGNDKRPFVIKENGYTENKAVNGKTGL